jgi:hypothetical protein
MDLSEWQKLARAMFQAQAELEDWTSDNGIRSLRKTVHHPLTAAESTPI